MEAVQGFDRVDCFDCAFAWDVGVLRGIGSISVQEPVEDYCCWKSWRCVQVM